MKCSVYILYSEMSDRYYIGSSEDPGRRLRQHNDPGYTGSRTTKVWAGPWKVVWKQECETRADAMHLEKRIKKQGARRYIQRTTSDSRLRREFSQAFRLKAPKDAG